MARRIDPRAGSWALLAVFFLAGCSGGEQQRATAAREDAGERTSASPTPAPSPALVPSALPSPAPSPGASPVPTAGTTPRYVGRWAANARLCTSGAWNFEAERLSTAGEVSCEFLEVRPVAGGYDLDATCLAEGQASEETIQLRFAESAGAMLVESKTFRPVGLIRCPSER